ncbi:MAG TPA: hypothetical protein P5119_08075 [Candidatus Aminicenantes bacterium]|nr:hypothetical protein [Candidatus Aminicenantes bacterium]HRY65283.1 hypothetical protein [Candidatus Aminicenantes bacterium]HRZ72249.1 hypothetical protein [Candidatus Aminicenantes bacterium]
MIKAPARISSRTVVTAAGLLAVLFLAPALRAAPRARYLAYARAAADWTYAHKAEILDQWRRSFDPLNVFGYRAPGGLLEMAVIYAYLYEAEKRPEYAARAKEVVLTYGDYRSAYPESSVKLRSDYAGGVPALSDFFTVMRYIRAFDALRRLGRLSPAEVDKATGLIAGSMTYLLRTAEWGPMNRSALRAESLAWAVRALPDHPDRPRWEMQRRALGDDNWGNWQIEDATIYNGVWLYSLLGYADALGRMKDLFAAPEMYYYASYYLNLMAPAGIVPDLGDAHWTSNWTHFLVYFEAAAAALKDPGLKWAAETIASRFVDFSKPTSAGLGAMLLDAYRWGTDAVRPTAPAALSTEVMEDVQGKKIVFRDGWTPRSSYLLLNYRDEGDGGLNFRDYLRDTIPVEEEKMTHGHADENSLVLLMSEGSVLLHDGGYRDFMPSGPYGAYRQDYFHNRLCVRPEKIFWGQKQGEYRYSVRDAVAGQPLLEFLRDAGSYRRVRTQKVDFLTFADFDYSRTRLIDEDWGYQADRIVVWVKDPGCYVVFDVFKARREGYFTLGALWHTRQVFARGDHWYDTGYDRIQTAVLPQDRRLLLLFPLREERIEGVEAEKRHYQDEWLIHQSWAQHFELGETCALVSVLVPHAASEDPQGWLGRVSAAPAGPDRAATGVVIRTGDREILVGIKNDLRRDISRDHRRPRYTYEAGRIEVAGLETDGDLVFASVRGGDIDYTIVNLTKALFRGRTLVEAGEGQYGLGFDAKPDRGGIGKMRYWRDRSPAR